MKTGDEPSGVVMVGGAPYQAISAPILSPTLSGWVVFAAKLDQHEMNALEQLSAIPLEAVVLDRRTNGGWASASEPLSAAEQAQVTTFLKGAARGKVAVTELQTREGAAMALAKPLRSMTGAEPAVLLLRYPLALALKPYQGLLYVIVGAGLAGFVLLAFGSWALARNVTRPISALDDAARRLQRGDAATVEVTTRDEIGRLADSFNTMAAAIGERERRITHLALHDGETDLPNRLSLERRIAALLAEDRGDVMVAALGVDRFSHVRGAIGYELAGALVREVGQRLGRRMPGAAVARLSSDTLGLVFQASGRDAAQAAMGKLLDALEAPIRLTGATIDVGLTIGLAELSAAPERAGSAVELANIAVDQARAARQKVAFFDPTAYGDPSGNLSLMSEMLKAIVANDLVLHHQPKYDIRQSRVTGVEALVRWKHPRRGLLSPDHFVPLAEDTGHIRAMTEWVLGQSIEHQAAMRLAREPLDMSVNISGRLLGDADFAETALRLAAKAEGRLCFEVTETAVIDNPDVALANIERFHDAGLGVSIDDYGAGLSSLAYLKQIKADELKIDKAFILNVDNSQRDALLVRSTIDLAHSLGLKVTAEGVETDTAYALLAGMGCDTAQGFLIARPMPLNELLMFLREDREANRRYG